MEEYVRCEKGKHTYNKSQYDTCPNCAQEASQPSSNPVTNNKTRLEAFSNPGRQKNGTRVIEKPQNIFDGKSKSDESKTVLILPGENKVSEATDKHKEGGTKGGVGLPSGWLVMVEGPGKGGVFTVGYGNNTVGRGESNRINIDFNDPEISRENQFTVVFDKNSNLFFIKQDSGASNLTYLNDAPILKPEMLKAYDRIKIGTSVFMFIPLCSDAFAWS